MGQGCPRAANLREELDVEVGLPRLVGEGLEVARRSAAGVVDQDVEPPEARDGGLDQALDVVHPRDVRHHA